MDVLGIFHLAVSVVALVAAGVIIALPKGRRTHRRAGWTIAIRRRLSGTLEPFLRTTPVQ